MNPLKEPLELRESTNHTLRAADIGEELSTARSSNLPCNAGIQFFYGKLEQDRKHKGNSLSYLAAPPRASFRLANYLFLPLGRLLQLPRPGCAQKTRS